jgi:hypothetical protein
MYKILMLLVSFGWVFGAALVVLVLISPRIPRTWAWGEVRHSRRGVTLTGVGMLLGATGVFLGVVIVFAWEAIRAGGI